MPDPALPTLQHQFKSHHLSLAMEYARKRFDRPTLATRGWDSHDFFEVSVRGVVDVVTDTFNAGYSAGLREGYRQGRSDGSLRARGKNHRTESRDVKVEWVAPEHKDLTYANP